MEEVDGHAVLLAMRLGFAGTIPILLETRADKLSRLLDEESPGQSPYQETAHDINA